ncbi:hypothetical protein M758_3G003500 [Ceratodon purpureus]|nr:hypothetical protein M758_3G003500 [Ceratodon purpureus]
MSSPAITTSCSTRLALLLRPAPSLQASSPSSCPSTLFHKIVWSSVSSGTSPPGVLVSDDSGLRLRLRRILRNTSTTMHKQSSAETVAVPTMMAKGVLFSSLCALPVPVLLSDADGSRVDGPILEKVTQFAAPQPKHFLVKKDDPPMATGVVSRTVVNFPQLLKCLPGPWKRSESRRLPPV